MLKEILSRLKCAWLVITRGGENMRFVFVTLIVNDRITIDAVSDKYKAVVLEDLKALGLDGYGKLIEQ